MDAYAQAPATLLYPTFIRVYFSCRPPRSQDGTFVSYVGFVDLDRSDPTKIVNISSTPILELGDRGTFDEYGIYPFSPLRIGSKIHGYFGGWSRPKSVPFDVSIGLATSTDGVTFSREYPGPVLTKSLNEPFVISGPKIRRFHDHYHLWYIAGRRWHHLRDTGRIEPEYRIRCATSVDGVHWKPMDRDLVTTIRGSGEAQASPDVFRGTNYFHMFFCHRDLTSYHRGAGAYRLGYATSEDLNTWTRCDEILNLSSSERGWDSEMISYPHVFEVDGAIFMAYLGNEFGRYGFGLARLVTPLES